jgi:hypothetical protein
MVDVLPRCVDSGKHVYREIVLLKRVVHDGIGRPTSETTMKFVSLKIDFTLSFPIQLAVRRSAEKLYIMMYAEYSSLRSMKDITGRIGVPSTITVYCFHS